MGSYDGAETCELVGSFLLSQLQKKLGQNIGLYRDDGLAITDASPKATESIKKDICRIFKDNGLRITIEANKQTINFLDVTFNLTKNSYQPYTKLNTTLQYVHQESNHPPITLKNIPAGINKRLSSLSSDKNSFDQAAPPYQKALHDSGYQYNLRYEPTAPARRSWNCSCVSFSYIYIYLFRSISDWYSGNCSVMLSTLWFENVHIISVVS